MAAKVWVTCFLTFLPYVLGNPIDSSFIVTSTEETETADASKEGPYDVQVVPKIYEMSIFVNISNRFAKTSIISKVKNTAEVPQESTFFVILPKTAYITKFIMEIDGKNYTGTLKGKLEARHIYTEAKYSGQTTAHVEANLRDSNKFAVSINVEPSKEAAFYLMYEELLKRRDYYEIVLNIQPKQPVQNLKVEVQIFESKPLKFVHAIPIRLGNGRKENGTDFAPKADIIPIDSKRCVVKFNPTVESDQDLALKLEEKEEEDDFFGRFVVQYDVERNYDGGEVLLKDGYFVHFFAPSNIEPLPKYVVFVLDTSGSMMFQKIEQLREAMKNILPQMREDDLFNIVEFNNDVKVWDLFNPSASVRFPKIKNEDEFWLSETHYFPIENVSFPIAYTPNEDLNQHSSNLLDKMDANGGTNIYEALRVGLRLIELQKRMDPEYVQRAMIMFLTDGEPTVGFTDPEEIITKLSELNVMKIPIFTLSFGDGADKEFLQKLSLKNYGFSRHIYEAADAALQLEGFFHEISSPLLHNVKFKYTRDAQNLTKTVFPIYFGGGEFVVTGNIDDIDEFEKNSEVSGWGVQGPIDLRPNFEEPTGELERLWAYLTVSQLLEDLEAADNKMEIEEKASELALKYSFVTPLTSLVVVKPDESEISIGAEDAAPLYEEDDGLLKSSKPIQVSADDVSGIMDFEGSEKTAEETDSQTNTVDDLMQTYQWFSSVYNQEHGSVILPQGTFKIITQDLPVNGTTLCTNPPVGFTNGTAFCKQLHACKKIKIYLQTVADYNKYFCTLQDTFAGVCCPVYNL